MRISDWSSDVCSSDLIDTGCGVVSAVIRREREGLSLISNASSSDGSACTGARLTVHNQVMRLVNGPAAGIVDVNGDLLLAGEGVWLPARSNRSEEQTSELQPLMRTSYAVFCLKKKKQQTPSHCTT